MITFTGYKGNYLFLVKILISTEVDKKKNHTGF